MTAEKLSLNTVLLAAGLSRRMGGINKLLIDIDGRALVRKVAKLYLSLSTSVTIILGHEADRVAEELSGLDVTILTNPDYAKGRQSTASYAIKHLKITGDAVVMALADQHRLTTDDLRDFFTAYSEGQREKILIPQFQGRRGNPILFPSTIARALQSDKQAPSCRQYIDKNPDNVHWFKTTSEHFIEDLDTPEDAERYGIPLDIKTAFKTAYTPE